MSDKHQTGPQAEGIGHNSTSADPEIAAIKEIWDILKNLDKPAQIRVRAYIKGRCEGYYE